MDYLLDMPMSYLLKRFENDIRFDAHSLETSVRRSEFGKRLHKRAQEAFPALIEWLEARPVDERQSLEDNVTVGLTILLCELGREMKFNLPACTFGERDAWLAWAKAAIPAEAESSANAG